MHKFVDLRSDTTTRPSEAMRHAIATAEVGDDVLDDDPTIHQLQEISAARMGKEAALFMPSGSMSNAVAIKAHTNPGDEILLDTDAHSMLYEVGMPATIANVLTRQFHGRAGIPDPDEIQNMIHRESLHGPGTTLLILENTHNRAGGVVTPLKVHEALWDIARDNDLKVHIDGARIFNAEAATGSPAAKFAACADTITFCLSKGLGCPVGSVLCGTHVFIKRARRVRKMLGGGMRQAGMLAAAGLFALANNVERLVEDHARARRLAQGIETARGITLDAGDVPTNMVYFTTCGSAATFAEQLRTEHGILCGPTSPKRIRLVTHLDIDDDDVDRAIEAIQKVGLAIGNAA